MNSKISIFLSTVAIAAIVLLFASESIFNQQAFAANLCGSGLDCGGCGFGFHHFCPYYGGFGFHHFCPYYGGFGCYGYQLPFP
jgi:hypothetical protein